MPLFRASMSLDKETLDQLLRSVRRYVRQRLVPIELQVDREECVPDEIIEEMKELGLFGLSIPEKFGGMELSAPEEVMVAQELGYTSPAFRSIFGTNIGIGSQAIIMDGTEEQKDHYLPRLASGELIGSFALTEPDAGSDAGSLRTRATLNGETYIINGTKRYITNAPRAGIFTLMARTGTQDDRARGISAFLIDADLPGIELGKAERKMGHKGSDICDVVLNNVKVPRAALIGGVEGKGFDTAMKVLDRGRLHISAVAVGTAKRLIQDSVNYANERRQFGSRIGDFQLIQALLADSQTEYYAGKCMVEETARRYTQEEPITEEISCCKLFCTEMVNRIADRAVQIFGGSGYIADYHVERFFRDVRLFRLYEGTSQIQQLIIAKSLLNK